MNDTYVTVVGNIVTVPERRRVESTGATVVNFRLGSTARRFDRPTGGWVDGNSLFVKVTCWRSLADNVFASVYKGDPVMVQGRLYTREYEAEDGTRRASYELEAVAVGHNMARGTTKFSKVRPGPATEVVEQPVHDEMVLDAEPGTDPHTGGEVAGPVKRDGEESGEESGEEPPRFGERHEPVGTAV